MEIMKDLVSVIIPTHNGSESIIRAVDSVVNQTYNNIEIIVVDDNGIGTPQQIETERLLNEKYGINSVIYITHEVSRRGSAARNTGLYASHGAYVAFLDDDDSFEKDNIGAHVDCLKKHDRTYGFSYCDFKVVREGFFTETIKSSYEGDFLYDFLMGKVRVGSSLLCFRRSVIEELNGFDESFKRHQDWELICRALHKWKGTRSGYVGVSKYILSRNTPKNPKVSEEYRLYYLNKMSSIIDSLGEKRKKNVLASNYYEISKDYFKAGDFYNGFMWIIKTRKPICYFIKTCIAMINKRKKMR